MFSKLSFVFAIVFFLILFSASDTQGATLTVTKTADSADGACDADCSLREAVTQAASGDTIVFDIPAADSNCAAGVCTVKLLLGEIGISKNLILSGANARNLRISGESLSRVFSITAGFEVNLYRLTVLNGRPPAGEGAGGILNFGTLNLNEVAVKDCFAVNGGGIGNGGTLNIYNSTVSGNRAEPGGASFGGGIGNGAGGTVKIFNSTVAGNSTTGAGGGIYNENGTITINNVTVSGNSTTASGGGIVNNPAFATNVFNVGSSIVAGNSDASSGTQDIGGIFVSQGYNLIGIITAGLGFPGTGDQTGTFAAPLNPQLGALANNGGQTDTFEPNCTSPARNAASPNLFSDSDQRGTPRPQNGRADAGAFEARCDTATVTNTNSDSSVGSLRWAIANVPPSGTIVFDQSLSGQTILTGNAPFVIDRNLTIDGSMLPGGITLSGGGISRVVIVELQQTAYLFNLNITGGAVAGNGGGILNRGFTTLNRVSVYGNTAGRGGGIYSYETGAEIGLTLYNSTLSGNRANDNYGGGIYNAEPLTLINSTIALNTASGQDSRGGGIYNLSRFVPVTTLNSLVASNYAAVSGPDIYQGRITSQGYNLIGNTGLNSGWIGTDIVNVLSQIAPLANYGGNGILTHALLSTSPAFDKIPFSAGVPITRDGRGVARPFGAKADIGAFESIGFLTVNPASLPTLFVGQPYSQTLTATGGTAAYQFALALGTLPPGLSLNSATGTISGTPTAGGNYNFSVSVLDAGGRLQIKDYAVSVNAVVSNANSDASVGSLRWAIANTVPGGTIRFAAGLDGQTISTGGAEFVIDRSLTLDGSTLPNGITLSGGGTTRVLRINAYAVVNLTNLNITGGRTGNRVSGAGIYNLGTTTLRNTAVYGNVSEFGGGGLYTEYSASLTFINSTVSGNTATGDGGGIYTVFSAVTLINSTVSANTGFRGAGIGRFNSSSGSGPITLKNSIVAGNRPQTSGGYAPDLFGFTTVTSQGYNLIGDTGGAGGFQPSDLLSVSPGLAPLADYRGRMMQAVLQDSPAVDGGGANADITTDGRGAPRPVDDPSLPNADNASDIGAFENHIRFGAVNFPAGTAGQSYAPVNLSATRLGAGGTPNFQFSLIPGGGNLPPGMTLSPGGTISGTPTAGGSYTFFIKALDTTDGIGGAQGFTVVIGNAYTISGRITRDGAAFAGAILNLSGAGAATTTNANGDYSFTFVPPGNYTLTPQLAGYRFTPASRSYANLSANQTGQDFTVGCGYDIDSSPINLNGAAYAGAFSVIAGTGCAWTATSSAAWLTVTGGASGTGGGRVDFSVALNTGATRTATITVGAGANTSVFTVIQAGTSVVTNANRSGAGSLRQALEDAIDGTLIVFDPAFFNTPRTIDLNPNGEQHNVLLITKAVTIQGPGANLLTVSANNRSRVFAVEPGLPLVTIRDLTMTQGGNVPDGGAMFVSSRLDLVNVRVTDSAAAGRGGAIYNNYQRIDIFNSTFSNNTVLNNGLGGAIFVQNQGSQTFGTGTLNVINSTFSANSAGTGGAVMSSQGTVTRITNSTFSGNSAGLGGGAAISQSGGNGFFLYNSTVTANGGAGNAPATVTATSAFTEARNSIIAGNTGGLCDMFGLNGSHNLIGNGDCSIGGGNIENGVNGNIVGTGANPVNARLKPLAGNGGATLTHALEADSPARDAGNNSFAFNPNGGEALTLDQRGIARIINSTVDIGAVESYNISLTQNVLPNGTMNAPYNFTLQAAGGVAPYSFAVNDGNLPSGLTLQANGQLSGTPTESGLFEFVVTVTDSNPGSGFVSQAANNQAVQLQILQPTAASVCVGGRVLNADGRGVSGAVILMTDANGSTRQTRTNSFGYYRFEDVGVGATYVFHVSHKRLQFAPQTVTVVEEMPNLDFVQVQSYGFSRER